jgi:hypothetical protein
MTSLITINVKFTGNKCSHFKQGSPPITTPEAESHLTDERGAESAANKLEFLYGQRFSFSYASVYCRPSYLLNEEKP